MKGFLILLEAGISIIILTAFYLYIVNQVEYAKKSYFFNIEEFRKLNESCNYFSNLIYYYNNFSKKIYCEFGKKKDVINREKVFMYLYAGYQKYNPKVIIIYK